MTGGGLVKTDGEYINSPDSPGTSSIAKVTKNVYMLCLVFLFEFSAFQGLANLQSSINCEGLDGFKGLGTISLAVTYSKKIQKNSQTFFKKLFQALTTEPIHHTLNLVQLRKLRTIEIGRKPFSNFFYFFFMSVCYSPHLSCLVT